jgi:hypothetical protein
VRSAASRRYAPLRSLSPVLGGRGSKGTMVTLGQRGLVVVTGILALWAGMDVFVTRTLARASQEMRPLTGVEEAVVDTHLRLVRAAPLLIIPAILAPAVVVLLWTFGCLRASHLGTPEQERRLLAAWLAWLAGGLAVVAGTLWVTSAARAHPPAALWLWLYVAVTWSYSGALHRAFRVHAQRVAAEASGVDTDWFAIIAKVAVFLGPLGLLVPVWVFWRASSDADDGRVRRPTRG